jgi:hypothetical protein
MRYQKMLKICPSGILFIEYGSMRGKISQYLDINIGFSSRTL